MIVSEFLIVFLVVILAAVGFTRRKLRYKRLPPGPLAWPFFGNLKQLRELSRKLGGQHEALVELCRQQQSPIISLRLGSGGNTIVVSGLECIQAALLAEEFDGRPWNYFISLRNMGMKKGITMNDGENWHEMRSWFVRSLRSVGFARREMSVFIKEELVQILQNMDNGGVREIKPFILPAIINVLWIFAAGKRFKEDRLEYFIDLLNRRAEAFDMTGGLLSAYPWLRHLAPNYSGYNLLVTLNNEFKIILMETIEEHKKNYVPGSEADLVDMFLNEIYAGKGSEAGYDNDSLVLILLDILLAGLNVTATTLEFLFLNILINQDSQRQLHEEIDRVIGHERLPDFSDRAKMPYADAVIMESQRLVPVLPIIGPRRVLHDTKLHDYDIPRDSTVILNLYSIHSDPNLYPEPRSFKPERFIKDGVRVKDDNLMIFGKGKRRCPGISLAQSSLFLIFVGIMQRYRLLPAPGSEPPSLQIKPGLSLSPIPYQVLLVPRISEKKITTD